MNLLKLKPTIDLSQHLAGNSMDEVAEQREMLTAMSENLKLSNERLKDANKELNTIFNKIDEALFSIDVVDRRVTQMSVGCEKIYGYTPLEFKADYDLWRKVIHPDDRDSFEESNKKLKSGLTVIQEYRIIHRNGSVRWVELKIFPSLDKNNWLIRVDGTAKEITERKIADEKIKESERRYRLVSENPILGIGWASTQGTVLNANKAFCEMLGYTYEEILDKHFSEFSHEDDLVIENPLFEKMIKGEISNYQIEKRYFTKSREIIWVLLNLSGVLKEDGSIDYFIGIIQDITTRKKAEEEAQESFKKIVANELLMKSAEGIAHFGSFLGHINENSLKWSDGAFRIFGYEPGEVEPSEELFLTHIHPEELEFVKKSLDTALKSLDTQKLSYRIIDRNGLIKHIQSELIIERNADGKPFRFTGLNQDVTEKIVLEKKLAREKKEKLQQMTAAVLTAQENERTFLAEELHDNINPLLATVKLYVDSAINNEENRIKLMKESKNFVGTAMDEIRKLSRSLIPPSLGEVTLTDAINDMIENITKVNDLRFISCWNITHESVLSDKLRLTVYRIMQEQFNNILKHAKASTVYLKLSQSSTNLELYIKDDGVGSDLNQKRNGVGLQNIINRSELFNGKVSIDSEPGNGFCLSINFPLHPESVPANPDILS